MLHNVLVHTVLLSCNAVNVSCLFHVLFSMPYNKVLLLSEYCNKHKYANVT